MFAFPFPSNSPVEQSGDTPDEKGNERKECDKERTGKKEGLVILW